MITRQEILHIGIKNSLVHNTLQYWRNGDCTFEQAMMIAVKALAENNEKLTDKLTKHIMRHGSG